ncbi:DapH/DapD/GlmU-related protein [Corynebacterium uterequi]|nr:DapH/DapD/GlmU-related protein [Corynebacterium uterequi]
MTRIGAQAIGIANIAIDGTILDTWYPSPELVHSDDLVSGTTRLGAADIPPSYLKLVTMDSDRMVEQVAVRTTISDINASPVDAHDVYLRLHLLSHRLLKPLEINLDGALKLLSTVVWTNKGPCLPDNFEYLRTNLRSRGLIHVYGIEKLPRMVDYVVPSGVSISEAERVRLGAYLSPGTRVLREGYVSYNAGTTGAARIEGRLTSGVVVGENTDIGLSAVVVSNRRGNGLRDPLRVGKSCTFGIGAGLSGISMGDECTIGPGIVIDRDSELFDVALNVTITGARLSGESRWTVANEAGYDVPTVRWH